MKLWRDSWLIFSRCMLAVLRNPVFMFIGVMQPLCYLLLFAPLLEQHVNALPGTNIYNVFTSGMVVFLAVMNGVVAGLLLVIDLKAGVIDRFLVTPVSRLALLLGMAARDIVIMLVQAVLMALAAVGLGMQADLVGFLICLVLLLVATLIMSCWSNSLALKLRDEQTIASLINFVSLPLPLLSGMLLPIALAPSWLQTVAKVNPFYYTVEAARALFDGRLNAGEVWWGFGVTVLVALLALYGAVRSFQKSAA